MYPFFSFPLKLSRFSTQLTHQINKL
jgi:hypothetical protein